MCSRPSFITHQTDNFIFLSKPVTAKTKSLTSWPRNQIPTSNPNEFFFQQVQYVKTTWPQGQPQKEGEGGRERKNFKYSLTQSVMIKNSFRREYEKFRQHLIIISQICCRLYTCCTCLTVDPSIQINQRLFYFAPRMR